jgi:hypothetical protein
VHISLLERSVATQAQRAPVKTPAQPAGQGFRIRKIFDSTWVYIAIMTALTALLFGKFLFSDTMLVSSDQLNGIDGRVFLRDAIVQDGQFPTWFVPRLSGMPSIDAMFGDAMYVPSLVFYALFPIYKATGLKMVMHVLLAGIFFFLLLSRGFRAPKPAAFAGALLYMFNPEFVTHVYPGHDGKMFVIAWLPFVLWRMKTLMDEPKILHATLLAFGIAMCLFTSHIQMTYFMLWGLFLFWVFSLALDWRGSRNIKALLPKAGLFWVAVFLGLAMAFVQFFPPFAFVREAFSVRGVDRGFEHAASWSLHWPEFFSLWVPEFGNALDYYWSENPFKLNSEYAGAIAVMLAALGVVFQPRPWRFFWAAIAALAVAYALGAHTPIFHIAYYVIPGVKKFRAGSMIMYWFSFAVVLLASLFILDVVRGEFAAMAEDRRKRWQKGLLIAIAVVSGVALLFSMQGFVKGLMRALTPAVMEKEQIFEQNFTKNFVPFLWLWWLFAVVILGMLWAVLANMLKPLTFLFVALAIAMIDVMRVDARFIQTVNPRPYFYTEPSLKALRTDMRTAPFRCYALPGSFRVQNALGIHGLESIDGFHDNELRWYRTFRGDQNNQHFLLGLIRQGPDGQAYLNEQGLARGNNFLNLANARYYVLRQGGALLTIENKNALGRVSFAPGYRVLDDAEAVSTLQSPAHDITAEVLLAEKPKESAMADDGRQSVASISASWKEYSPNYRKVEVTAPADGFLRLSEVFYPGWEIKVDGKAVDYYRADVAWMAFAITKGKHTIEMMPRSLYLREASMVSFPTIAAVIAYWLFMGWVNRKRRRSSSESKS